MKTANKKIIVYILGLFENRKNGLFLSIKRYTKKKGIECLPIKLYGKKGFGSYEFNKEITRIREKIEKINPLLIISHSLGAYITTQLPFLENLLLLDPSFEISDIISKNAKLVKGTHTYNDGENKIKLSDKFIRSIKKINSIKKITKKRFSNVFIIGAKKGGQKIAKKYHRLMKKSVYVCLQKADHQFSRTNDRKKIFKIIKKQLDLRATK